MDYQDILEIAFRYFLPWCAGFAALATVWVKYLSIKSKREVALAKIASDERIVIKKLSHDKGIHKDKHGLDENKYKTSLEFRELEDYKTKAKEQEEKLNAENEDLKKQLANAGPTKAKSIQAEMDAKELRINASRLLKKGLDEQGQNNIKNAINFYTQAIGFDPNFYHAYMLRALAFNSLEDPVTANADFSVIIKLKQKLPSAYLMRGLNYRNLKQKQNAITDLKKYLELTDVDDPQVEAIKIFVLDLGGSLD